MKNLNIIRKSFVAAFATFVALTMTLTGCLKDYEMDLPLAVTSRALNLSKEAGSTHVLVYSDGEWTARLTRPVKWASIDRQSGFGNHEIVFSYSANYGISRQIGVVFQKGALADTVVFSQAGSLSEAQLSFTSGAMTLVRSGAEVFAPIKTNLQYALGDVEAEIIYYDENGLANEPLPVEMTRQDGELDGEEGEGEGEGEGDEPIVPEEPVVLPVDPWISGLHLTKNGLAFQVTANEGLFPRTAEIKLMISDANGTDYSTVCSISQGLTDPMFALEAATGSYSGLSQTVLVPTTDNNMAAYAPYFEKEIVYTEPVEEGKEWIKNVTITAEGLQFNLTVNENDTPRHATINLSYADAAGNTVSATYAVTQAIYPQAIAFDAVRKMTPGEITTPGYIEGYIVGDSNSKNMAGNEFDFSHEKTFNLYDRTVNDKTNYFESKDGKYGFRLVFDASSDNNLPRYTALKLAIEGLTLVKNNSPEYYTLTGVTASNFLEVGAADQFKVPAKEKAIAELTDDDIFTMCTIKGLEIMCKDGAYTNIHEGYTWKDGTINKIGAGSDSRLDQASLLMYDRSGDRIMMLTNILVPWRRDGTDVAWGSVVPQGSGNFKGIVVHDEVAEIDLGAEYMGRYQLRAMVEEDIDLDAESAFTTTLVEWTWNDGVNNLTPEIGSGSINHSGSSASAYHDFNNTYIPKHNTEELTGVPGKPMAGAANNKGMVQTAAQRFYNLWHNADKVFEVSFSTTGVTGSNLMFGMTWMCGNLALTNAQVPYNWEMSYSIDGKATFKKIDDVVCRTTGVYTGCPIDASPQYSELLRKLPAECFNQENVVIRFTPVGKATANKTVSTIANFATNYCQGTGNLTETNKDNCRLCVGTITVRYN